MGCFIEAAGEGTLGWETSRDNYVSVSYVTDYRAGKECITTWYAWASVFQPEQLIGSL